LVRSAVPFWVRTICAALARVCAISFIRISLHGVHWFASWCVCAKQSKPILPAPTACRGSSRKPGGFFKAGVIGQAPRESLITPADSGARPSRGIVRPRLSTRRTGRAVLGPPRRGIGRRGSGPFQADDQFPAPLEKADRQGAADHQDQVDLEPFGGPGGNCLLLRGAGASAAPGGLRPGQAPDEDGCQEKKLAGCGFHYGDLR
jgi:hypothetical protein